MTSFSVSFHGNVGPAELQRFLENKGCTHIQIAMGRQLSVSGIYAPPTSMNGGFGTGYTFEANGGKIGGKLKTAPM
ncbi:unnamed protein product [Urochloa humidicola]